MRIDGAALRREQRGGDDGQKHSPRLHLELARLAKFGPASNNFAAQFMSFLTALLDQQASKTQPELPAGGDTKTAFRLPASKSLPALKPSASSSSLQVVNIEVPSSDLNTVSYTHLTLPTKA